MRSEELIEGILAKRNYYWFEFQSAKTHLRNHFFDMYAKYRDLLEFIYYEDVYLCGRCRRQKAIAKDVNLKWIQDYSCFQCEKDKKERKEELQELSSGILPKGNIQ